MNKVGQPQHEKTKLEHWRPNDSQQLWPTFRDNKPSLPHIIDGLTTDTRNFKPTKPPWPKICWNVSQLPGVQDTNPHLPAAKEPAYHGQSWHNLSPLGPIEFFHPWLLTSPCSDCRCMGSAKSLAVLSLIPLKKTTHLGASISHTRTVRMMDLGGSWVTMRRFLTP